MERAIEFLINNQANFDARLAETNRQIGELREAVAETNRIVQLNAGTVTEFVQAVTGYMGAQGEVNANLRDAIAHTDAKVDKLAETVERFISGGRAGEG
jgi:hypothetical protein